MSNKQNQEIMKASKTVVTFEKMFKGYSTQIEVIFGQNSKSEFFNKINQINTSLDAINEIERDFEDGKIDFFKVSHILESNGYVIKSFKN